MAAEPPVLASVGGLRANPLPRRLSFTDLRFVVFYLLLLLAGVAATSLNSVIGRWLLPFLATLPALVVLYDRYDQEDLPGALREMLLAAVWMSVGMLLMFGLLFPVTDLGAGPAGVIPVIHGPEYVGEMFNWLRTGQGAEADPAQFVPQHLQHFAIVGGSSLLTGGAAAFLFGAVQMGYMNAYVYSLATFAGTPDRAILVFLFGWHIYSLVRVVSFITLATGLGYPGFALLRRRTIPWPLIARFVAVAAGLELLDLLLKWQFAEAIRQILVGLTELV